jgi:large subunit ribosomal protein L3
MGVGMIGKKLAMMNVFDEAGRAEGVTLVEYFDLTVVALKTVEKDGYEAIVVGWDSYERDPKGGDAKLKNDARAARITLPVAGKSKHIEGKLFRRLKEFRVDDASAFEIGQVLDHTEFESGIRVKITSNSKGRGFQGGMKRHNFHGGEASHGAEQIHRRPMSAGATDAARVFKGMRMPGRMGGKRTTSLNLEVKQLDPDRHILAVRGSVPGPYGGTVIVNKQRN